MSNIKDTSGKIEKLEIRFKMKAIDLFWDTLAFSSSIIIACYIYNMVK